MAVTKSVKKGRSTGPLFLVVCGLALVGGLTLYVQQPAARDVPAAQLRPEARPQPDRTKSQEVRSYTPRYEGEDLKLKASPARSPEGTDARVFAVNRYLEQLPMVPRGARARSCVVKDGLATVDFTGEFDRTYGTEDEQTVLKGILTVMAQFPEVDRVQVTVDGRPIETLGSVEISQPLPVERPEPDEANGAGPTPPTS